MTVVDCVGVDCRLLLLVADYRALVVEYTGCLFSVRILVIGAKLYLPDLYYLIFFKVTTYFSSIMVILKTALQQTLKKKSDWSSTKCLPIDINFSYVNA